MQNEVWGCVEILPVCSPEVFYQPQIIGIVMKLHGTIPSYSFEKHERK